MADALDRAAPAMVGIYAAQEPSASADDDRPADGRRDLDERAARRSTSASPTAIDPPVQIAAQVRSRQVPRERAAGKARRATEGGHHAPTTPARADARLRRTPEALPQPTPAAPTSPTAAGRPRRRRARRAGRSTSADASRRAAGRPTPRGRRRRAHGSPWRMRARSPSSARSPASPSGRRRSSPPKRPVDAGPRGAAEGARQDRRRRPSSTPAASRAPGECRPTPAGAPSSPAFQQAGG